MPEFDGHPPGTPCWIDLQTTDVQGAAAFYNRLFGWELQDLGPESGGYGFFLKGGRMVAGVMPKMNPEAPTSFSTYVGVTDVDATTARVRENGGSVVVEPMDVMTAGRMAFFIDPTGAAVGAWQPGDHKGAQLANETGAWGWSELQTRDVERATGFYRAVFGWTASPFGDGGGYIVFERDGRGIGGCMAMPAEVPAEVPSAWLTYFGVDDADGAVGIVKEMGGGVLMPPTDMPTVGRLAVVRDPQGAVLAVIRPAPPPQS